MERRDSAPERTDHPVLQRAYEHATSVQGAWRMRFNIPMTDPRWLEATEEQIVEDMLACMYWDAAVRRETNPSAELRDQMEKAPEAFAEVDRRVHDLLAPEGAIGRLLRQSEAKPETAAPTKIRLAARQVVKHG